MFPKRMKTLDISKPRKRTVRTEVIRRNHHTLVKFDAEDRGTGHKRLLGVGHGTMVGRNVVALGLGDGKGVIVIESRVRWSGLLPEGWVLRCVNVGYGVSLGVLRLRRPS